MIEEFFLNPRKFIAPILGADKTKSIREFYERCIARGYSDKFIESAKHWHKLICQYAQEAKKGAVILPIRLWENLGPRSDKNGKGNGSRRRALTLCPDGFSYAFASNSFARAVYSMVLSGVSASKDEFRDLMNNFRMRIGFHWGNESADESEIAAYPIAYPRKFYLDGWYLAHIHGVGDEAYRGHEDIVESVFPVGQVHDWHMEDLHGARIPVRRIKNNLTDAEKDVAVAHFIRFLDPLNYFLVPSEKNESHYPRTDRRIGEERIVRDYMDFQMKNLFPKEYKEFCELALIDDGNRMYREADMGDAPLTVFFGKGTDGKREKKVMFPISRSHQETTLSSVGHVTTAQPKVMRRMQSWAEHPGSNPHKMLLAFCRCDNGTMMATKVDMQRECMARGMSVKCFKASFASMLTDAGNSYGHTFEYERGNDEVRIWDPIKDEFRKYRRAFFAFFA